MKKLLPGLTIIILIMVVTFNAFAQKNDKKDNNKNQHGQGKNQEKHTKQGNGNNGVKKYEKKADKVYTKDNRANKNGNRNNGNTNSGNNRNDNGNKFGDKNLGKNNKRINNTDGYYWDNESFKDRKKLKNLEKVTLCHKFKSNNQPGVTINVSSNALKAHMNHGDVMGSCPTVSDNRFSDVFLRRRTTYYNDLQNSNEQVIYSRSILDYAVGRLTNSRLQLATLRNNNVPIVEIQRKQATVVQLEQNVSLLQTLIGVAAELVVNKLSN